MARDRAVRICKNHKDAFIYHGDYCPWCEFAANMVKKLQAEYRRGFEDGVKAADIENAKKEAEHVKRSDADMQPSKADGAVLKDVHPKHKG